MSHGSHRRSVCSVGTFPINTFTLSRLRLLTLKYSKWNLSFLFQFTAVGGFSHCVYECGKDKHTYLLHSQRHAYAVFFHQHAAAGLSVCVYCTVCLSLPILSRLSWSHRRQAQTSFGLQGPSFFSLSSFVLLMSVVHGVKPSPLCQWVSAVFLLFPSLTLCCLVFPFCFSPSINLLHPSVTFQLLFSLPLLVTSAFLVCCLQSPLPIVCSVFLPLSLFACADLREKLVISAEVSLEPTP